MRAASMRDSSTRARRRGRRERSAEPSGPCAELASAPRSLAATACRRLLSRALASAPIASQFCPGTRSARLFEAVTDLSALFEKLAPTSRPSAAASSPPHLDPTRSRLDRSPPFVHIRKTRRYHANSDAGSRGRPSRCYARLDRHRTRRPATEWCGRSLGTAAHLCLDSEESQLIPRVRVITEVLVRITACGVCVVCPCPSLIMA